MTIFNSIYDVAELAVTKLGLKGIDWDALIAAGRGSVWDRDYIRSYMLPAQIQMITNIGGMTFDAGQKLDQLDSSYSTTQSELESVANTVLMLANQGGVLQAATLEVGLTKEAIAMVVSHAYQTANYGFLLHADETIHHSGMSDAEIAAHANTCTGVMNALVMLRTMKVFEALGIDENQVAQQESQRAQAAVQARATTSGLGLAPAWIAAIVVVIVAGIITLAWVIVSIVDLNSKNKIVAQMCTNAQSSGDAAMTQQCLKTITSPDKNAATTIPNAIKSALSAMLPYAVGGVALYVLYLSMPYIVKNFFAKKAPA